MRVGDEKCSGNQAVLKGWQKCFGDPMFRITGEGRFSLSLSFLVCLPKAEDTHYTPAAKNFRNRILESI
jgi:hypothetical protein